MLIVQYSFNTYIHYHLFIHYKWLILNIKLVIQIFVIHIYDYNNFISIYICLVYNFAAAQVQNFMVMGANVQTTKLCECEWEPLIVVSNSRQSEQMQVHWKHQ